MVLSFRSFVVASAGALMLSLAGASTAAAGPCYLYDKNNPDLGGSFTCDFDGANTGGLFVTDEQHPAGTGFIDSFLRVQQNGWEQGYNTSYRPIEGDMHSKTDPNFTRTITVDDLSTKVINGVTYYEFFLDVNEPAAAVGSKFIITLDQLEIYGSNTADLHDYSGTANNATGQLCYENGLTCAQKVYDLDTAAKDNWVNINYLVTGQGSGSSDMVFYLNSALLGNYEYVYLFSQFGSIDGNSKKFNSQAGFEEWFSGIGDGGGGGGPLNPIPEPSSLLLLGTGLGAAARRWRKSRAKV